MTDHIGPVILKQLHHHKVNLEALIQRPKRGYEFGLSERQCGALGTVPPDWLAAVARTELWLQQGHMRFVMTLDDGDYPSNLLEMTDPPALLYGTGHRALLHDRAGLGIVGTRNPTAQGLKDAHRFSAHLAQQGMVIVSGMALGIDAAAHEGALSVAPQTGPNTIAIVGTGLDIVYPKANTSLMARIQQEGLVLSEFALGTGPQRMHFPKRNRLIAGWSIGTLVIEAGTASGSLITAQMATDMGREVFAVPGSIHATQSKGCHALIKQGAKLVESAQDIIDELPQHVVRTTRISAPPAANETQAIGLKTAEQALLDQMGLAPTTLENLVVVTGMAVPTLQTLLFDLELAGHVVRMPGGQFQHVR